MLAQPYIASEPGFPLIAGPRFAAYPTQPQPSAREPQQTKLHRCTLYQHCHSVSPLCIHDATNCPTQLYAHNDPSYSYSSLPHFLSSALTAAPQLAVLGRFASFPCDRSVPKHSRRSSTRRSGASHAGMWLGLWCRFTHAMSHDDEPHISGVTLLLLRAWKELMPRGTEQYLLHCISVDSRCARRSQRSACKIRVPSADELGDQGMQGYSRKAKNAPEYVA